jgi:hypothetical protein
MRRGREENLHQSEVRMTLLGADLYASCERRNNEVTRDRLEARLNVLKQQNPVVVNDIATVEDLITACNLHTAVRPGLLKNKIQTHLYGHVENEITKYFSTFGEVIEYAKSLASSAKDKAEARAFLARYRFGEHTVITMDQWIEYNALLTSAPKNVLFRIDHRITTNQINQRLAMIANNPSILSLLINDRAFHFIEDGPVHAIDLQRLHSLKSLELIGQFDEGVLFAANYPALTTLVIESTGFNSPLPTSMPALQVLKIQGGRFNQPLPSSLPLLKSLTIGYVFNQPLPDLPLLQELNVNSAPFNSALPAQLPALTKLTIVSLNFDQSLPLELPSLLHLFISSRTFNQVLPVMPVLEGLTILSNAYVPDDLVLPFDANIAIERYE